MYNDYTYFSVPLSVISVQGQKTWNNECYLVCNEHVDIMLCRVTAVSVIELYLCDRGPSCIYFSEGPRQQPPQVPGLAKESTAGSYLKTKRRYIF